MIIASSICIASRLYIDRNLYADPFYAPKQSVNHCWMCHLVQAGNYTPTHQQQQQSLSQAKQCMWGQSVFSLVSQLCRIQLMTAQTRPWSLQLTSNASWFWRKSLAVEKWVIAPTGVTTPCMPSFLCYATQRCACHRLFKVCLKMRHTHGLGCVTS